MNGWFRSGDTMYRDVDGYFFFCGRGDDMLKVGGIWVAPFEIESALAAHPAVIEAAVVGAPDENGLIKPKGFCVLRDHGLAGRALEQELIGFIKQRLAPFKNPRWIEFIEELPKTASGKIQRYKLRRAREAVPLDQFLA
jgi:acyl-coenzyme A synthetase/AMP-(fatty) acid ligase